MKNQKLFILVILTALFGIDVHVQAQSITALGWFQVESTTNIGRDYDIKCGSRQEVYAANDLVTHTQGHAQFEVGIGGAANRGFTVVDGVSGTTFFYANAQSQRVGIGVSGNTPKSKLQVSGGDVYIESDSTGLIMRAPNSTCYRLTVGNGGSPTEPAVFKLIPCP